MEGFYERSKYVEGALWWRSGNDEEEVDWEVKEEWEEGFRYYMGSRRSGKFK